MPHTLPTLAAGNASATTTPRLKSQVRLTAATTLKIASVATGCGKCGVSAQTGANNAAPASIIDYAVIVLYFVFVIGIGVALKRFVKTGLDFFLSGRSLATWITALAFISANLGAQEVIGMSASGA